jgi:hypothetical protein
MLVKNKDASFLTKSLQARTVYANQAVQQQKFEQGCGRQPRIDGGSAGTLEFSNKILLSEGEVLTSPTFKASLLAANACPTPAAAATGPTDQIAASLTTSLAAYTAASTNDWIEITSAEYAALQVNVTNTSQCGVNDTTLTTANLTSLAGIQIIVSPIVNSPNVLSIAANSYLYAVAFTYYVNNVSGIRIFTNTNTASKTGFVQVGNALPATTAATQAVQYYVRKGASTTNGATEGRLAIWDASPTSGLVTKGSAGTGTDYLHSVTVPTSSSNLNQAIASTVSLQGLTTTTRQW